MKLSIRLLMSCLVFTSLFSQSTLWNELSIPLIPGRPYVFVDFADSVHGVLTSNDGAVTITSDGGRRWISPIQLPAKAKILSVKMADSGTVLIAAMLPSGPMVYMITESGATLDSLTIKTRILQANFNAAMVSILNKDMIGYRDYVNYQTDRNASFIYTKNFGKTRDTLQVKRGVKSSVQAVDTSIIFLHMELSMIWGRHSMAPSIGATIKGRHLHQVECRSDGEWCVFLSPVCRSVFGDEEVIVAQMSAKVNFP